MFIIRDCMAVRTKAKPARRVAKEDYETLSAFRYALRRFLRFSESAAENAGLTPQQHQALLAIKGFPGRDQVTIGELAERLQLRHHSAVGLVDRLEERSLILRKPSVADRREVNVRVSRRGMNLLERLSAAHKEELQRIAPQLATLIEALGKP